jgi:predicted dehydrogenase
MAEPVRLAVAGAGYWGINLVRAFARVPGAQLVAVCDPDERARTRAAQLAPGARLEGAFEALLGAADVDAIVLGTPAVHHAAQAQAALAAGKHVFVEKPLALTAREAHATVEAARLARRTLMVGHLMLYHPAFRRLCELVQGGELGRVYYLYALRVNLGRLRRDENALWSFAPHDLAMILALVPSPPVTVAARGEAYLQEGVEDVVFLNLGFADRTMAQIQLSWLDPRKERRLTVVGSKKMVELDDVHPTEKLRIYDKGYDRPPEFTQYGEYLTVRQGDVHIPRVDAGEPLDLECRHFVDCLQTGARPRSDGESALRVVEILEAATTSLRDGGRPVALLGG